LVVTCFVLLVVNTACVERSILLPEEAVEPRLVVLAYAAEGLQVQVFISRLLPLSMDSIKYGVPDAEVTLYKNGKLEAELFYQKIQNCGDQIGDDGICLFSSSKHISDDSLQLESGARYYIEVKAAGFPTVRSESILFTPQVQDLRIDATVRDSINISSRRLGLIIDSISLEYNYTGDITDQLFLFLKNNYWYRFDEGIYQQIFDPRSYYPIPLDPLNTDTQQFISPGPIFNGYDTYLQEYSFSLHIARYPTNYIEFVDLVNNQDSDISGLYASAPAPIPTNMIGGEGYFVIIEHYKIGDFIVEQ